jgi:hypothetical protein
VQTLQCCCNYVVAYCIYSVVALGNRVSLQKTRPDKRQEEWEGVFTLLYNTKVTRALASSRGSTSSDQEDDEYRGLPCLKTFQVINEDLGVVH